LGYNSATVGVDLLAPELFQAPAFDDDGHNDRFADDEDFYYEPAYIKDEEME
jgi:hypothetical protein